MLISGKDGRMVWKMQNNSNQEVQLPWFVVKLVACVLLLMILISTLRLLFEDKVDDSRRDSDAYHLEILERDYTKHDFSDVYEQLTLYDLQGDVYAPYWEIANARADYLLCRAYQNCIGTPQEESVDAAANAKAALAQLKQDMEQCQDTRNLKLITTWYNELEE